MQDDGQLQPHTGVRRGHEMHTPVMAGCIKMVARFAPSRRDREIIRSNREFMTVEPPPGMVVIEMNRGVGSLPIPMTKVAIGERKVPRSVETRQGTHGP